MLNVCLIFTPQHIETQMQQDNKITAESVDINKAGGNKQDGTGSEKVAENVSEKNQTSYSLLDKIQT
jgi:hypothetical protein